MTTPNNIPLAYTGIDSINPRDTFYRRRAPTPNDFRSYSLGDRWIDTLNNDAFILVDKSNNNAIWVMTGVFPGNIAQVTTDAGIALPAAGNIDLLGQPDMFFSAAGNTISGIDRTKLSNYVVGPGLNYTTIQSALNAAGAAGIPAIVYVWPGTYAENLVLPDNSIRLQGISNDNLIQAVTLNGTITGTAIGVNFFSVQNFNLVSAGDGITFSGVAPLRAELINCSISTGIGFSGLVVNCLSGTNGFVVIDKCNFNADISAILATQRNILLCFDSAFLVGGLFMNIAATSVGSVFFNEINSSDASGFFVGGAGAINNAESVLSGPSVGIDPGLVT